MSVARGDGVGIELTADVVRGVRLAHDAPDRLSRAAEMPVVADDDRQALDTLVLLWAELGEPTEPTRIGVFPIGSTLQRIDVTGRSGPELSALRSSLLRRRGLDSSVIVDDGPRRWLLVIGWDVAHVRRVEQLAERAGFRDVSVEPSPVSVARVVAATSTVCRRSAARDDGFVVVLDRAVPVAAANVDVASRQYPAIELGEPDLPHPWFEDLVDAEALDDLLARSAAALDLDRTGRSPASVAASAGGTSYPSFPAHDVRALERQVVALGAAAAAAGLSATARPIDILVGDDDSDRFDRPWVWERVSELPEVEPGTGPTAIQRAGARFVPRRRSWKGRTRDS